ncbi:MAG: ROK family protein, partial [Bacilli bacterium]
LEKWKMKTITQKSADDFYDYVVSGMRETGDITHIGISAPGLVDEGSNVKSYAAPNCRVMYGTNINEEIGRRTGKKVRSINDAKSAGLCELKMGHAVGTKSSAFLIIGTGTGGCVCDANGVVYGTDGYAGEFHHLPYLNVSTGEIERMGDAASMTALVNGYRERSGDENVTRGSEVAARYLAGETTAVAAVDKWLQSISVQLLTMIAFYNPEVICVGGGVSEEQWFMDALQEKFGELRASYFMGAPITTRLAACKYNNDANILGAVLHVLDEIC